MTQFYNPLLLEMVVKRIRLMVLFVFDRRRIELEGNDKLIEFINWKNQY